MKTYTMPSCPLWLLLLTIMLVKFVHVLARNYWFLLIAGQCFMVGSHHDLCVCSSVDGHLGSFRVLTLMDTGAMNVPEQVIR